MKPMPLIATTAVLCFVGWFAFGKGGLWEMHRLRQRQERQTQKLAELEARRDYLKQRLADLKANDPQALEQAARDFGLVAPGETIYEIKVEPDKKK